MATKKTLSRNAPRTKARKPARTSRAPRATAKTSQTHSEGPEVVVPSDARVVRVDGKTEPGDEPGTQAKPPWLSQGIRRDLDAENRCLLKGDAGFRDDCEHATVGELVRLLFESCKTDNFLESVLYTLDDDLRVLNQAITESDLCETSPDTVERFLLRMEYRANIAVELNRRMQRAAKVQSEVQS